jgi:VanZ family protein
MNFIRLVFFSSLAAVFILSIVNANEIPRINALGFLTDKVVHLIIYLYLALIGLMCSFKTRKIVLVFYIFMFGFFIEIIHIFHPNRFFEYFDLLANLIGVTIALQIYRFKTK